AGIKPFCRSDSHKRIARPYHSLTRLMMPERFRRFLPDPHTLRQHRALRWMGPMLHHPRLWLSIAAGLPWASPSACFSAC
ncbi:MAG: hypothetical protein M0Z99_35580, partial [Betaproteobacteria bacterium]|nr:hypothetical protein [Betaproteobacteria bacterium]